MHNLSVVLFAPDIPQNTGNIIRLCANTGVCLHLIKPLGWGLMDNKKLLRAGLDYHEFTQVKVYDSWQDFIKIINNRRIIAVETNGSNFYDKICYLQDDILLFGSETKGLPKWLLDEIGQHNIMRLPMLPQQRSLNLSNSVAIIIYEAWRQLKFINGV